MTIELYVTPPSPRAFKVMAVANHLGLPFTRHYVDIRNGGQKTPEYAALNPNMRMPTLKEGDTVLWEANAIMQYLALKRPESGLLPIGEVERIDVTRWQFWDVAHWEAACAIFLFEHFVKPQLGLGEPDAAALAKGSEEFHRAARVLDGQLAHRLYVTGEALTLADFALAPPLTFAEAGHFPVESYGHIQRWFEQMSRLPSWQMTLAECEDPQTVAA